MSRFIGNVSAYAYAVSQGYTGTEEEFAALMASYASVAEEAAESAENASQSAESASTSAQTATSKASEASTSATQAGASATSASQSASTATTKASEASASASTASTKANEASQSATTASTKASEASASATSAQTAQTAAEGSATTAQTAAQTATQKAAEAAESARTLTIDPTLTQSGQAADSKVVGDRIEGAERELGEVDDILGGIKTRVITRTLSATGRFTVNVNSIIGETVINPDSPESSNTWHHVVLPCANVDHFAVTATGGMSFRPYFFLDANNVLLAYALGSTYDGNVAIPEHASKIVVQASSAAGTVTAYGVKGELNDVHDNVDTLMTQTEEAFAKLKKYSYGYDTTYEKSEKPSIVTDKMDDAIKSIMLYGEGTGLEGYDKMYVLDGSENWRASTAFENSYRGPNVLAEDLANNYSPGMVDGYSVQTAVSDRVKSIRLGPEITVIKTGLATVDEWKAHLAENPVTIWYKSDNYDATGQQYYACSIARGDGSDIAYPAIGITEKIEPLSDGDTLDFVGGTLIRNDNTSDVLPTNRTLYGINGILTLSSQGEISVSYARNLSNKLQSITGAENPIPMLTIIDDDGHHGFHDIVLPLIISKHVPIASAVVTNRANGDTTSSSWMSWDEIMECYENGAEILCHNFTHMSAETAATLSTEEMQWNYQKAKNQLREHGITSDIFVYNGATGDMAQCIEAAKRVFRGAIKSGGNITNFTSHGDRWGIRRYPCDDRLSDVNELYALVDKVKSTGGWMIWMVHTSDTLTADTIGNLGLAIDYARAQGVAIVTAECGFDYYVECFWGR